MNNITELTRQLYSDIPKDTLYHYTTLSGLLGIVDKGVLWASDIRYMNDSAELKHTADLIRQEVQRRLSLGFAHADLLSQFVDWVTYRITNGHILFGASFRSHGNLLSQWRGYSLPGKGVSLGFSPDHILHCANQHHFQIGKCIYDSNKQRLLIEQIIDMVITLAQDCATPSEPGAPIPPGVCNKIFGKIETDLLRIAAILKHPSFQEEEEWRLVSPVYTDFENSPVRFREGKAMLVPYVEFGLKDHTSKSIALEHLYLGPTPNITISMNSLKMFLAKNGINPSRGIDYCQIPYRQK